MLLKILPFAQHTQVLCQYRLCTADHVQLTYLMLQRPPPSLTLIYIRFVLIKG
jgi:hypothetical protein